VHRPLRFIRSIRARVLFLPQWNTDLSYRAAEASDRRRATRYRVLALRGIGPTKELIDWKHCSTIELCCVHKVQDSFELGEEVTATRLDRMLHSNRGHDFRSGRGPQQPNTRRGPNLILWTLLPSPCKPKPGLDKLEADSPVGRRGARAMRMRGPFDHVWRLPH
jgi:hypothetical protein